METINEAPQDSEMTELRKNSARFDMAAAMARESLLKNKKSRLTFHL